MTKAKRKTGLLRLIEIAGTKSWWLFGSILLAALSAIAQFVPYVAVYKILVELADHATELHLVDRHLIEHWAITSCVSILVFGVLLYGSTMLSHIAAFNILYEMRMALAMFAALPVALFIFAGSTKLIRYQGALMHRDVAFFLKEVSP